MSFGDLLVTGATWALAIGAAWAVLIVVAGVVEVLSSGRLAATARLGCPAPARRALLAGLGLVLASGGAVVAGPVSAAPAPLGSDTRTGLGLPVPARPTGSAYALPRQRVEVQPGDCLWRLAREHSRTTTSQQDLARMVARTYLANRRVIGADPDLIRPGQRLRIPLQRQDQPRH
ncbi:LysM peptidoglycan-binding domain-containing protein [Marmoricola sp. URHB0036]|uniref:LysM peptidoglycan-binding domain-containing protein n=1 Tax=Marmoricola sp. URHB0036 TaxID=1298863 RepID=UPI000409D0A1|nr:LysM peptidoglycan-binding domain-containing protein [Marmoricola sp. URHB0036]